MFVLVLMKAVKAAYPFVLNVAETSHLKKDPIAHFMGVQTTEVRMWGLVGIHKNWRVEMFDKTKN